jgi:hypothetical protein
MSGETFDGAIKPLQKLGVAGKTSSPDSADAVQISITRSDLRELVFAVRLCHLNQFLTRDHAVSLLSAIGAKLPKGELQTANKRGC